MNDTPFAFALAEARVLAASSRFWLIFLAITALVFATGPFGTFDSLVLGVRLVYWTMVSLGSFWLGFLTSMTCASHAEDWDLSPRVSVVLGGMIAGVPIALFVAALDVAFFAEPFLSSVRMLTPYASFVAVIVGLIYEGFGTAARHKTKVTDAGQNWLNKLPAEVGREILWLQAQDHYVLARTRLGETLIRGSLSEADAALRGYGLRVHRSWWVAQDQMDRLTHSGGAGKLFLKNGEAVPVGRAFRKEVRAALSAQKADT
ncbi:LytTR family DNA-binding domain-containing protein [uncultured Roseobacter sp.]|uniref:LytTR family DNA-binding domain-containing protein n=1 Tax=uncultured Roseobacter sp. TaxID=114847 RepID=UPI002619A9FF|nr:LytTR family DNA-binding domain-containing protein [uncultured Roseobacter sp.]